MVKGMIEPAHFYGEEMQDIRAYRPNTSVLQVKSVQEVSRMH
jgi:hypothetical protein